MILLSDHMLRMIEKSFTGYGCTRCSTIYWMTECPTETFWLTDQDAGTKPLNRNSAKTGRMVCLCLKAFSLNAYDLRILSSAFLTEIFDLCGKELKYA